MKLSRVERFILSNQYLILEKFDPDNAEHYARGRKALAEGYEIEYDGLAEGIYDDPHCLAEDECKEVLEILTMFKALHFSFAELADKSGIEESHLRFSGFDGNNELKQLGYAQYVAERFPETDTSLNSHWPMLPLYRQMLTEWNKIEGIEQSHLSKDAIKRITTVSA
jgi:uncharacterized protein